ncbi:MAG TPA: YfiR family protein [Rhodocyclaceae bacterium]|nr:YfiR family protein [Rhodocyclaceae bacterium]
MHRLLRLFLLACPLWAAAFPAWSALPESEVRAAIIVNFIHYVEWPDAYAPNSDVRICVVGQGNTVDALMAFNGKSIHGLRVTVENRSYYPSSTTSCRVLFIGESSTRSPIDWLREVSGQPVLTVSEGDDFLPIGGIISLNRIGSRITFDVNLAAMRRSSLRIGSQLLRLARDVHGK